MAEAIKTISVARGYDVTRYALNSFGGAGGQHACDVADALAITTMLIHPLSSLLSAYGMGLADIRAHRAQGVEEPLDAGALARVGLIADALADAAVAEVEGQGVEREAITVHRRAHLRYAGSDTPIEVALRLAGRDAARIRAGAQGALRLHRPRQGARHRGRVGARRSAAAARFAERDAAVSQGGAARARSRRRGSSPRARGATRTYTCARSLPIGARVDGPALVIEPHQTIVVEDWLARCDHAKKPCRDAARRSLCRGARRSAPRPIR